MCALWRGAGRTLLAVLLLTAELSAMVTVEEVVYMPPPFCSHTRHTAKRLKLSV